VCQLKILFATVFQGCQIVFDPTYQNEKIYKLVTRLGNKEQLVKTPKNNIVVFQNFPQLGFSNWYFWYVNTYAIFEIFQNFSKCTQTGVFGLQNVPSGIPAVFNQSVGPSCGADEHELPELTGRQIAGPAFCGLNNK
jgi:hypothetical protein